MLDTTQNHKRQSAIRQTVSFDAKDGDIIEGIPNSITRFCQRLASVIIFAITAAGGAALGAVVCLILGITAGLIPFRLC